MTMTTNKPTGVAVDAFRKLVKAEQKVENRKIELAIALRDPDVEMDKYLDLTEQIEEAADRGDKVHNVGLAEVER